MESHTESALGIIRLFTFLHSGGYKLLYYCGFNLHFLDYQCNLVHFHAFIGHGFLSLSLILVVPFQFLDLF